MRVLIAYKSLPQYRVPFYERLRQRLEADGIELKLVVGQAPGHDAARNDEAKLRWAVEKRNRVYSIGSRAAIWQPILREARACDLVVVEQANKLLANYALLALQGLGGTRVAFWGHGANLQARRRESAEERVKARISRLPHWWFAYTEGSAERVVAHGFPSDRITVVQNAQDTEELAAAVAAVTPAATDDFRVQHGLGTGPVGLYLGSLYPDKRLDFLVRAARVVVDRIPGFRLVIAGDGPERGEIVTASREHPWITYVGRVDGVDVRAQLLAAADLLLNPGLVGLVVLDAFAGGVPMVTTAFPYHSPEIEYLRDGINGVIVDDFEDVEAYAAAVVEVLGNQACRDRLRLGCAEGSRKYTLAEMVDRFATGVTSALAA